ncbi:hypothetical protein LPB86_07425 [Pedobacter sp. MC2016-14]|uniref:hypothetical protein n=1 Tax=Pedobacter sp. MC2016-14 TaxID=2897327 RepID=UPI001E426887|nr:hypothetical protein [Pedobacter sp. MC2016-14]MCD0488054.1 hypothetical protein [Pedobacter sp. MC2016-14]
MNLINGWGEVTPWGYKTAFANLVEQGGKQVVRGYTLPGVNINEMKSNRNWLIDRQRELWGDDAYNNGYIAHQYGDISKVYVRNIADEIQESLDMVGLLPGVGEFADGTSGLISLGRGNYQAAGLSFAAMVPFAGWAATGGKYTLKYTKSSLKMGQKMHKAYKAELHNPAAKMFKEYVLPSGKRIDFLDAANGIIYELKPFNPRGIKAGKNQLNLYMKELESMPRFQGIEWKKVLDTY